MRMGCVRANTLAFCVKSAVFFVNPSVFCVIPSVFCVISPRNSLTFCVKSAVFVVDSSVFSVNSPEPTTNIWGNPQWIWTNSVFISHEFRLKFARIRTKSTWNCDETGLCTCTSVSSKRVICQRGVRVVSEIGSGSGRENITVLACGSAIGERIPDPPYVVYKAQNLDVS